ncbi:MAG: putative manganese-dependent inorganic diphosphatase [Lachnospiraceae bacterium]|nr:putative manganese-dependent inorganic diphosphatase [Lachnospiraceae bacterium]MBQ2031756.1 putative manganese-dependent inorganic diphosphatase [Lachnospiraceae bacterium]
MTTHEKKVLVIGHKNPDTDSICSAIAYAALREKQTGKKHVPRCCGEINAETAYVLNRFGVPAPDYIEYVGTQVKDIEIREQPGVNCDMSLKRAWLTMQETHVVTLCITDAEGHLDGLITISDIAKAAMELSDSGILSAAQTPYENILDTLDGTLLVGEVAGLRYTKGKVLIAAANPDLMEDYIKPGDLVILGNRYESQLCAIEMGASCLVVCEGAKVSVTIRRLAEEKGCVIMQSPHDAFTVARLIDLSMPIGYFMTTENLVTFRTDDYIDSIRDVMAKRRNRDFPILDHKGIFRGTISRRNLMDMSRKQVILVDHNEPAQAVDGVEEADILEIIDHHRIGGLYTFQPVYFRNEPLGCTATIVYLRYRELNADIPADIAGLLCSAILSDTLAFHSPTCTAVDREAAETLAKIAGVDMVELADSMFAAGSHLAERSPEEIFYQDYKKFKIGSLTLGVGQINSMSAEELTGIESRLKPYLSDTMSGNGIDMLFFMLTNITTETSRIIFAGEGAGELLHEAFGAKLEDGVCEVPRLVSRKKQLIPGLSAILQN